MSTVSHASLTGADLHEPKGAASAASGTVYVCNGSGSGTWTTLSALTGTVGKIEIFSLPVVPSGYLECNGSAVSRTTYADLFTAVSIQQTGSRSNGVATITGLSDTSNMKAGYAIGGSGIVNGTTILSVDSPTQVTMSANANSTGSGTVVVSPWTLGNGTTTFTLPNMTDSNRFPRSRSSSVVSGTYQSNQNKTHDHTFTTNSEGAGTTSNASFDHTHNVTLASNNIAYASGANVLGVFGSGSGTTFASGGQSVTHNHTTPNHIHTGTTVTSGGSEARPESVCFLFCVKY